MAKTVKKEKVINYKNRRMLYDAVTNKWFNYFEDNPNGESSSVWQDGYDDPTYLTFKVEFGEWGASVLDRSVLDLGVTTFKAKYADYDQLPMGLLNAPTESMAHDTNMWQDMASLDSKIFNNTQMYSAFTYLRSRNEDVRAEYIMHFVNGLFDIQKKYPYIFKKISGLDGLETVDVTKGRRIQDTEITLDCYEGLDLKIKTLLELYRKAAWDDVYQKWILPENMREFKMIIYIFERRTFQKFDSKESNATLSLDDEINLNVPVKVYECYPCEFQLGSIWSNEYEQSWESGGETTTQIKIKVKNVRTFYKNGLMNSQVHKFYRGQNDAELDAKIEPLLIYDLVDMMDRAYAINEGSDISGIENSTNSKQASVVTYSSINGVRSRFMAKNVFLGNEEYSTYGSKSPGSWGAVKSTAPQSVLASSSALYCYLGGTSSPNKSAMIGADHTADGDNIGLYGYPGMNSLSSDNAPFYYYYVNRPIGYGRLAFSSPIGNIIKLAGELISPRTVPYTNLYMLPLPEPFWPSGSSYSERQMKTDKMISLATHIPGEGSNLDQYRPISEIGKLNGNTLDYTEDWYKTGTIDGSLNDNKTVASQNLIELNPSTSNQASDNLQTLNAIADRNVGIDPASTVIHGRPPYNPAELNEVNQTRVLLPEELLQPSDTVIQTEQSLNQVLNGRQIPEDELKHPLNKERTITDTLVDMQLKDPEKPEDSLVLLDYVPTQVTQELSTLNDPADKKDEDQLNVLNEPVYKPADELNKLTDKKESVKQASLQQLNKPRPITQQEFDLLNEPPAKDKKELQTVIPKARSIEDQLQSFVDKIRELPDMEMYSLNDAKEIPEDKLKSLENQLSDVQPNYQADKDKLIDLVTDIPQAKEFNDQLISYDESFKKQEAEQLASLQVNQALNELQNVPSDDANIIRKQQLLDHIKDYANNSDELKSQYAIDLIAKKQELIKLTIDSIKQLPQVDMFVLKENEKENNDVLISLNDIKQIEKNIELIALEDKNIQDLSTPSLIKLNDAIEEQMKNTQSMIGLTKKVENKNRQKLVKLEKGEAKKDLSRADKKRLGASAKLNDNPKSKKSNKIVY